MSVENTLAERGARYGSFEEHATIAQAIQDAFRIYPEKWEKLPPVIKQGFTTLADKIARTLNGDEYYDDNDIYEYDLANEREFDCYYHNITDELIDE